MATNGTFVQSSALYDTIQLSSLSWIEQQWAAWYMWIGNPVLATGLLTLIIHELAYFGRCIPFMIVDAMPSMRKYKLQPNKIPTPAEQWECTKFVLFAHFTMEAPLIWLFQPMAEYLGMQTYQVPFPSWSKIALHIFAFFVFEDFFHFLAHQMLHMPMLYKHIHKIHHKYSAPFGLAAEYAHPAEVAILGTGTIGGPLLWCWMTQDLHLFTIQLWIILRLFQAIDSHSGYDFPWSLQHILPFWSGADHHDFHHMAFTNNFSTSFRWWDHIFGTDDKYREYKKKIAAMKKKAASEQDFARIEQELLAEVERVGAIEEQAVVDSASKKVKAA